MFFQEDFAENFSPLRYNIDPIQKLASHHFVQLSTINPEGQSKPLSQVEEVLSWQTLNVKAQNNFLKKIWFKD